MADFSNRDNLGTTGRTGAAGAGDWATEEGYWRNNWATRPYATADRGFDYYRPGYRYGFESAGSHRGRDWNDVEGDLRSGWDRYEHRGQSTWENVKDAVRDAWDRVAHGKHR
jgi:hypothetical protein